MFSEHITINFLGEGVAIVVVAGGIMIKKTKI